MVVLKRKQVLIVGVAALVAIAGYLNFSYGNTKNETPETLGEVRLVSGNASDSSDFFSQARLEREIGRSQSVASLQTMVQDTSTSAEGRAMAEQEMVKISRLSETEANVESMICAKGFEDAVLYIEEDSATVIVKAETLEETDVAKIVDIITSQTGIPAANIKIVEAKYKMNPQTADSFFTYLDATPSFS